MYKIKEAFYSLQGEGARTGRAAVFCRFSKCNLWNGRERDRAQAVCNFCDTDFIGQDGQNGGKFETAEQLADHLASLWPDMSKGRPYVICTGGEPLLQLDETLIDRLHLAGFEVAVETNGTLPLPAALDWVCVSPKGTSKVVVRACDEVKLVYPQPDYPPEKALEIQADHYYLSPMASPTFLIDGDKRKKTNTERALAYCLANPTWQLTLQTHKILDID
ncbi:MAG: 7-carboxy-7-deazaguanine synthase [Gammaproteobacteria bacterium]|nr:MAG: 7-carboxy-7-deazaguanine synthase [Pseudomonadota bacterium]PIE38324.1 MAG: 7-carboxy-7-deazaguanine synthase [Gammaproteobacteria bacterium]